MNKISNQVSTSVPKTVHAAVLTIFNKKGGIGKSTFTINTALHASPRKIRVLVIDNDAQMNTSNTLVMDVQRETKNSLKASMLFDEALPENLKPYVVDDYLHIIVGDKQLDDIDSLVDVQDIASRREMYNNYRRNVHSLRNDYDLIVIDTPTTAVHRFYSALVAATACVAPTTVDAFGMDGVLDLQTTIREIKATYGNTALNYLGIVPNKVLKRSALHARTLAELAAAKVKALDVVVYFRSDVENKLAIGKRSPAMKPAVDAILKEIM